LSRALALTALAACVLAAAGSGCESTFDRAKAKAAEDAKHRVVEKGLTFTPNPAIKVSTAAVITSSDATAVVLRVRNTDANGGVVWAPLSLKLKDASGKVVASNTAGGTNPSLQRLPSLAPGAQAFYVNDQLTPQGAVKTVDAVVGGRSTALQHGLPKLAVKGFRIDASDPFGLAFKGTVTNTSTVDQPQLVVQAIAEKGARIVAAGTAVLTNLKPQSSQPFSGYWVGNPKGARLSVFVPPTATQDAPGSQAG